MSWLRYSDDYTRDRIWDGMSYEARWHFKALVEECSQSRRWDGWMPLGRALRASDVPDPSGCLIELRQAGIVCVTGDVTGNTVGNTIDYATHIDDCVTDHALGIALPTIEDHIPTEGNRDENLLPRKRANQAAWRARKCAGGNHSKECPAATCPVKLAKKAAHDQQAQTDSVTERVTDLAGTGRYGTARETLTSSKSNSRSKTSNDVAREGSGSVDDAWSDSDVKVAVPGQAKPQEPTFPHLRERAAEFAAKAHNQR